MGRLFWTFPDGLPGIGLLVMRVVLALSLISLCVANWPAETLPSMLCAAESLSAILLLAGFLTPVGSACASGIELWRAYSNPSDAFAHVLLATIAASLTLIGPGASSVDARVFGWRRLDVRSKGSSPNSN